jgi:PAS domain S-box-containing protein
VVRRQSDELQEISTEDVQILIHELKMHQVELEMQNEELRRVQRELEIAHDKYSVPYDSASVGCVTISEKGTILEANLTAATMLGVERGRLIEQPLTRFIAEDDQDIYYHHRRELFRNQEPQVCELQMVKESGSWFWARIEVRASMDSEGDVVCRATLSDITGRRQAEEELRWRSKADRATANLSAALLERVSIEDIAYRVLRHARRLTGSAFGYVGYINRKTGYLVCPTMTRDIWDTCQVPGKDIVFEQFGGLWGWVLDNRKSILTNTPSEDSRSSGTPEGHLPIRRFLSVPALIGDELVGQIALANAESDYTERDLALVERLASLYALAFQRRRAEEKLEHYAAELRRSNEELEQFAYAVSHDLQEPLRTVTSFLRLLERRYEDQLDAKGEKFIDYAVDGAERMQEMISALLDLSRVATRGEDPTPTETKRTLDRTLKALGRAIEGAEAEVTYDPLPTVMADRAQLAQIFQNLIANAIKFRREGVPPRVHVSAEREGDEWVFSVADNGIGIDPEQANRIFQIFQRLHTRNEYEGTGIGLALCKRIVERHGGRIWVESEPGEGSTFYFTLPVQPSANLQT